MSAMCFSQVKWFYAGPIYCPTCIRLDGESPTVQTSDINEVSIPYSEFLEKLEAGQVASVDFLAPNGDTAYATLKPTAVEGEDGGSTENTKPIRIGEGYPIEGKH